MCVFVGYLYTYTYLHTHTQVHTTCNLHGLHQTCACVCVCVCGALGRPLRWLTLLGGRANCPELPPECQGARQVLSTNFWLVAVPMAPDKGLGNVRQLSEVISGQ